MIAMGLWGDGHGWWDNKAFATNLVSGLASVLFGIPTALFVLSRVTSVQTERVLRQAALGRARAEFARFEVALLAGFEDVEEGAQAVALQELKRLTSHALRRVERSRLVDIGVCLNRVLTQPGHSERIHDWLESLLGQWEQVERLISPHLSSLGVSPQQTLTVRRALAKLLELDPAPFMTRLPMYGDLAAPQTYERLNSTLSASTLLLSVVEELPDLKRGIH